MMISSRAEKKHKKSKNKYHATSTPRVQSTTSTRDVDGYKLSTFEDELTWCLSQLQIGVQTSRTEKQQKSSCEKNYKTLLSAKTPLARKRQLMRSLFGDYRSKMKSNPLAPSSGAAKVVVAKIDSSRYFRQAFAKSNVDQGDTSSTSTNNGTFLFDFDITS